MSCPLREGDTVFILHGPNQDVVECLVVGYSHIGPFGEEQIMLYRTDGEDTDGEDCDNQYGRYADELYRSREEATTSRGRTSS